MDEIGIVDLASPPQTAGPWNENLASMRSFGLTTRLAINETPLGPWPRITDQDGPRLERFLTLLRSPNVRLINALRGGYGCSNLLPHMPWQQLALQKPKVLIGFSDISAMQSAFFHVLGWPSIHGPMPGNKMWNLEDFQKALRLASDGSLELAITDLVPERALSLKTGQSALLFGGCLSVLTNLIGTPYLQPFRRPAILFFEDIDEGPGRVLRMLNQWQQSGMLENVHAVILGRFCYGKDEDESLYTPVIHEIFKQRLAQKIYQSTDFGHASPNAPLVIGGIANIREQKLLYGMPNHETFT